jgi:hypothetical protein
MRRQIELTTRRELTAAIRQRYQAADRNSKKLILDEFIKVTGYHRKHAIRALDTVKGDKSTTLSPSASAGLPVRGPSASSTVYREKVR